ncbi:MULTISPECIES: hypothetical protein [Saccharothrix]|uniref:hypothetical protein n=1 Tax=Saccharothrix TaxID=2071 RepID=UPI00093E1453|nr:hypothetical protein [Saccharothrix sp. CB00851]
MTDEVSRTAQQSTGACGRQDRVPRFDSPVVMPSARQLDIQPVSGVPIACTLTGDEQAERVGEWRDLLKGSRPEGIANGLRWRLPSARAGQAAELASAEQRCCAFFDFTLHLTAGELILEARAPEEAAELFLDVFGTPAGTAAASAGEARR